MVFLFLKDKGHTQGMEDSSDKGYKDIKKEINEKIEEDINTKLISYNVL